MRNAQFVVIYKTVGRIEAVSTLPSESFTMPVMQQERDIVTKPEDLISKVRSSLGKLSYNQLDNVDCILEGTDHVKLTGQLKSYYLKQIAHTIALKVPGVRQVTNNILVTGS